MLLKSGVWSAVEAMMGILMCGLSTGLFCTVFAKVFGLNRGKRSGGLN
jgi:hypothetical protein